MASNVGVAVYVDTRSFNRLASDLRRFAPEAYKAAQIALRGLTKRTLSKAAANASFSTQIPGSGRTSVRLLKGKVQFGSGGGGGTRAYIAAPIENRGEGYVEHPVFGNKRGQSSTNKNSHPAFLAPAFDESKEEALAIMDDAVFGAFERMTGMV